MAQSDDHTREFFDWVQKMWTPQAFGLAANPMAGFGAAAAGATAMPGLPGMPGLFTPTADPRELERRIAELQAVETWLRMNVGFIQMTVKTLELQKSALESISRMSGSAQSDPK